MQSQTDPNSYIIKNLSSLKQWQPYQSSLIPVVEELSQMMSQKFPFKKRKHPPKENFQMNNQFANMSPYNQTGMNMNPAINEDAYKHNTYSGTNAGFIPQGNFGYIPQGQGNNMYQPMQYGQQNNMGGGMGQYQVGNMPTYNNNQNLQSPHYNNFSNPMFDNFDTKTNTSPNPGFS